MPVSLDVNQPREPDTRSGAKPGRLLGEVSVSDLAPGTQYAIWRWDSTEAAFDYSGAPAHVFTSTAATYTWADPNHIMSDSATYYRCVPAYTVLRSVPRAES